MIQSLELENFKAFGARVKIPLAPITLLFGENSAGKSSVLHAINLLKQTREAREPGAVLLPRAENGIVDLGSFQEFAYNHEQERDVSIRLDVSGPPLASRTSSRVVGYGLEMVFYRPSVSREITLKCFDIWLRFDGSSSERIARFEPTKVSGHEARQLRLFTRIQRRVNVNTVAFKATWVTDDPRIWEIDYNSSKDQRDTIIEAIRLEQERLTSTGRHSDPQSASLDLDTDSDQDIDSLRHALEESLEFYDSEYSLESFIERRRRQEEKTIVDVDGFIPVSRLHIGTDVDLQLRMVGTLRLARWQLLDIGRLALIAGSSVESTLEEVFPLGPFRRPPERWYIFTGTSPRDVGYRGDLLPDLLLRRPDLVEQADEWLDRLRVGYHLRIHQIGPEIRDLFEVRLIDTTKEVPVEVGLADVGFGLSQLLPFVVQSLASTRKIISIEQPEVHIHPRLQADLGDLLAYSIKPPNNNQFIVETHSEHLILRIQKLLRMKTLVPSEVSVLFIKRGASGSQVYELRLDEDGDFIDEWPGGFFPERLNELI